MYKESLRSVCDRGRRCNLEIDYVLRPRQEVVVYSKGIVYVMLELMQLRKVKYTLGKKQSFEIASMRGSTEGRGTRRPSRADEASLYELRRPQSQLSSKAFHANAD